MWEWTMSETPRIPSRMGYKRGQHEAIRSSVQCVVMMNEGTLT